MSTLLYLLTLEVFGNQVRQNEQIKGLKVNGTEIKILQYANDTEIIISDDNSMKHVFKEIQLFQLATGAKANLERTEGLWLGKWKNRADNPKRM